MNCPRCATAMVAEDHAGTELDRCPTCQGVWLDKGEGEKVTRPSDVSEELLTAAIDDTAQAVDGSQEEILGCPRCGSMMEAEKYDRSGVEIDRCECGVWLDGGELEKIAAYRAKRLDEIGERYGKPNPGTLERIYSRTYFEVGKKRGETRSRKKKKD